MAPDYNLTEDNDAWLRITTFWRHNEKTMRLHDNRIAQFNSLQKVTSYDASHVQNDADLQMTSRNDADLQIRQIMTPEDNNRINNPYSIPDRKKTGFDVCHFMTSKYNLAAIT